MLHQDLIITHEATVAFHICTEDGSGGYMEGRGVWHVRRSSFRPGDAAVPLAGTDGCSKTYSQPILPFLSDQPVKRNVVGTFLTFQ